MIQTVVVLPYELGGFLEGVHPTILPRACQRGGLLKKLRRLILHDMVHDYALEILELMFQIVNLEECSLVLLFK